MHKQNTTLRALKILSSYNRAYFPICFFQSLFAEISPYFSLWMSAEIVTALYAQKGKNEIITLVLITLLGNLAFQVLSALFSRQKETAREILLNNEARALNQKVLSLDYDKLENPELRNKRRQILESSWINHFGTKHLLDHATAALDYVISLLLCLVLFTEMLTLIFSAPFHFSSILFLIGIILCMGIQLVFSKHYSKKMTDFITVVTNQMLEENRYGQGCPSYRAGKDVRLYKQLPYFVALEKRLHADSRRLNITLQSKVFTSDWVNRVLTSVLSMIAYLFVCFYCIMGIFPIGSIIKYVSYLHFFTGDIRDLLGIFSEEKTNTPYLEAYLDFLATPNDMYQGSLSVEKRSDKKFEIEFRNVSFRYPETDTDVLKNINFKFRVGERLALVGMNGSGKTTLIKLLCRLYDPTAGEIIMNDFNIRKYDYRQYLDIFSIVFQDYNLLSFTLGQNIAASDTYDAAKAERYLCEIGFADRYATLEKKLETPLYKDFDEEGIEVSGGEAQKIALARALYKDAPFIILDEPTAALDPLSEAEIYSKFDEIVGDKTAIYISHRLSSCRFCDKIIVLDKGEIVQYGTHEELLTDTYGKYHELWHAQAQYYT